MEFAPAIYEHAARLIDHTPWEVSRSGEFLFSAHRRAWQTYGHRPVVVGIDIYNLEAEALGAVVGRPEGNAIPAISHHPCNSLDDLLKLPRLNPDDGRLPMVLEAATRLKHDCPEADVRLPVSGPFSIASNLLGFEPLLFAMIDHPAEVTRALLRLNDGQEAFVKAAHRAGLGVAFFDSGATPPLVAPAQFHDVVLPALADMIERASSTLGRPVPCIIGGNTLPILPDILSTGTGYVICPSETDQAAFMHSMTDHPEVMVRINTDPGIVARGDMQTVTEEVQRVMALAGTRPNVCIGTGALPYETDPQTVARIAEIIRQATT
ncbi:MAG: uroporphyrinogen decarboxylase family protein [Planctomycetota bacterium]